ncbi:MAG: TRAP transporter small permease [Rhodoferax sp.]|nr:TRAP transporter small permease [Rhodoferax sp.]
MSGPHPDPGQNRVALRGFGLGVQRLRAALTALSAALLASYFVLVLLQVFFRYVLNESLFWAEELVRGLMVWGVMVSSALVAASRDHIRVEVLELMLPPTGRRIVVRIANVLCIAFSLILLWAAIQLMDRSWFQQSPLLQVPKWTVYMAIAVGAVLEALLMLLTWNQEPPAEPRMDPSL